MKLHIRLRIDELYEDLRMSRRPLISIDVVSRPFINVKIPVYTFSLQLKHLI